MFRYSSFCRLVLFFFILMGVFPVWAAAQVNISVQILPPYPHRISDYASNPHQVVVAVMSQAQSEQRVQLRGTVIGDNGVSIRVSESYRSSDPLLLGAFQTRNLNGNDIAYFFDYTRLTFSGMTRDEFIRRDGLPEGTYRLCIQAFDYDSGAALSADEPLGCSNPFTIMSLEPPTIIRPFDGETISALPGQIFTLTWSSAVGSPPSTRYRIRMVEIADERPAAAAMLSATQPYFFDEEVTGTMYVYKPSDPQLTPGRRYAVMLEAFTPDGSATFRNEGRSEVVGFVFGEELVADAPPVVIPPIARPPQEDEDDDVPPQPPVVPVPADPYSNRDVNCECHTQLTNRNVLTNPARVQVGSKVGVGRFTMEVTRVEHHEQGRISGEGIVEVPLFRDTSVPVRFSGIQLNEDLQLMDGQIHSGDTELNTPFNPARPHQTISADQSVAFEALSRQPQRLVSGGSVTALPLGVDRMVAGERQIIWITRMVFTPTAAVFDAGYFLEMPDAFPSVAAFGTSGQCFEPDRLCGNGSLYLHEELSLGIAGNQFRLGSGTGNNASRISFDQQGFQQLHLRAEFSFPTSKLVRAEGGGAVTARISTDTPSWSDWMATVEMDAFRIAGLPDFTFRPQQITYDHSDTRNPQGIKAEYVQGHGALWHGFYIADAQIDLPRIVKKLGQNTPVRAPGSNFVIDADGLTGSLSMAPVFALNEGDLAGWAYSVERISLNFRKNSFESGSMNGRIQLPFTDAASSLSYTSTLSSGPGGIGFQFNVGQTRDLKVPMWKATFALDNSTIEVNVGGGQSASAKVRMNGSLSIRERLPVVGQVDFNLMRFQNLTFGSSAPYFEQGSVTFFAQASAQKSLGGFPISIPEKPRFISTAQQVGIQFPIQLSLADIPAIPKAEVTLGVMGKPAQRGGRLSFEFDKVEVDKISVDGKLGAFQVKGEIEFFSDDPKWGDGLEGDLNTTFFGTFSVNARALFGKRDRNYWFLDARLNLDAGIPIGPGISVFGFGGGAYYNLRMNTDPQRAVSFNYGNSKPRDLYQYSAGMIGFKAGINLGSSDGRILLVMGDLEASFSTETAALRQLGIKANGAMFAPSLSEIEGAVVKAGADIVYDVQHSVFSARAAISMNVLSIMQAQADMSILSAPDGWHFKLGDPVRPVREWPGVQIQITPAIKLAEGRFYFNVGNKDMNLPPNIASVWNKVMGGAGANNNFAAKGLFFGADHTLMNIDLEFLIFYMKLTAWYAFDIALLDTRGHKVECGDRTEIGINDFYALGRAQADVAFDFGLFVDVWFFEGRVRVGKVSASADLNVALPNPTWIGGQLRANYNVLGGLVKGTMRFRVNIGERCTVQTNPFAGLPIIADILPADDERDVSILSDVTVGLNFYLDKEFQIEEPRDNGGFNVHTFKAMITSARISGPGVNVNYTNDAYGNRSGNGTVGRTYNDMIAVFFGWDQAFEPRSRYTVVIEAEGFEKKGNQWVRVDGSFQSERATFTTGSCVNDLHSGSGSTQTVVGSYPFPGQRYFTPQQHNQGYLNLKMAIPCLVPGSGSGISPQDTQQLLSSMQQNTTMVAVFKHGSETFESTATAQGDRIRFAIPPQLKPNTIYRLQLVTRLTNSFMQQLNVNANRLAGLRANMQTMSLGQSAADLGNQQFTEAISVRTNMVLGDAMQYSSRYLDADNTVHVAAKHAIRQLRSRDQVMYTMHFRTSQFPTLRAKLNTITAGRGTVKLLDLMEFTLSSAEPFDVYEIRGWSYSNPNNPQQTLIIPPLIEFKEDIAQNPWFMKHMIPVADHFSNLSRYVQIPAHMYHEDYWQLMDRASFWNPRLGSNHRYGRQREIAFDAPTDVKPPLSASEIGIFGIGLIDQVREIDRNINMIQTLGLSAPANRFNGGSNP